MKVLLAHTPQMRRDYYGERSLNGLRAVAEVKLHEGDDALDAAALVDAARDVEIIVADRMTPGPGEIFAKLPKLRAFVRCAVDIRNIDVAAASAAGVLVTRASPGFVQSVAELAIGYMVDLSRGVSRATADYHAGRAPEVVMGRQLAGSRIGIIGFGSIGRYLAGLAKALGMEVLVADPFVTIDDASIQHVPLDDLLGRADYVVCLAIANEATENLIGQAALARMQKHAFFINLSRGNLVDEAALAAALRENRIAGAALDVGRAPDQMPSPELAKLPNVIATPHVGGLTPQAIEHQSSETVRQVAAIIRGEAPDGAVNAESWTRRPETRRLMQSRLPFYYGWMIVVVVFVTMAIGVNARTAFSLLFPPIIGEFGWDRGVTAGAFSFGFVVSAVMSPLIGRLMDRYGPRGVMELGVVLMGGGMLLAPLTTQPWHLYLTIGVLVGAGSVCLGYSGQSLFVPNWFVRRRGLAIGIAFAGVGIGSVTLLPWVQHMIEQTGWRTSCTAMGILIIVVLAPINLLLHKRPEDIGLLPDGDPAPTATSAKARLQHRRSRLGRHRLDLEPRDAHRALLVDRDRLFLRPVHLVRGAGAPDQIPARHRLQSDCRRLGARHRQPARHSRPDLARPSLRPHRPRIGVGDCLLRLRHLLCRAGRAEICAEPAAGLSDGVHARRARLRPHLGDGAGGAGDFSGQALRQHLWHHHARRTCGRRRGAVGDRRCCSTSPATTPRLSPSALP